MTRLSDAFAAASRYHAGHVRKGTRIPYVSHLMSVCAIVLEAGGTETEACAALLHDAAEDVTIPGMGGEDVLREIAAQFGDEVAAIVRACSDVLPEAGVEKPPWLQRKQQYLLHLGDAGASTLLVSAADKLHNLRSIAADERVHGAALWERFSAPPDKRLNSLWYYRSLLEVYLSADTPADPRRDAVAQQIGEILERLEFENETVPLAPALELTFDPDAQAGYIRYRQPHADAQIKCDIFEGPDHEPEVVVDREADGGVFGVEFLGLGAPVVAQLRAVLERYRLEEPAGLGELIEAAARD